MGKEHEVCEHCGTAVVMAAWKIREAVGCGSAPMLAELGDVVAAKIARIEAENAAMREVVQAARAVVASGGSVHDVLRLGDVLRAHDAKMGAL